MTHAMSERVISLPDTECGQNGLVGDDAQRKNHASRFEQRELGLQITIALGYFSRLRFVLRR